MFIFSLANEGSEVASRHRRDIKRVVGRNP